MICLLTASKYDELDENIPLISDLIKYYSRMLPSDTIPTYD
jgi:Cyclin, C-terminal domain